MPTGATVVIPHNCYLGVAAAVRRTRRPSRLDESGGSMSPTRPRCWPPATDADLVWIESPTNPTMEVADLPAIGAGLPDGRRFVVDNTFATPLLQRPLSPAPTSCCTRAPS